MSKSTKKQVAKKTAKRPARKTGCNVDHAIKLMRRPNGATRADLNEADFRQPSISALRVAENRGHKVRLVKKEGERARYYVTGSARVL